MHINKIKMAIEKTRKKMPMTYLRQYKQMFYIILKSSPA